MIEIITSNLRILKMMKLRATYKMHTMLLITIHNNDIQHLGSYLNIQHTFDTMSFIENAVTALYYTFMKI